MLIFHLLFGALHFLSIKIVSQKTRDYKSSGLYKYLMYHTDQYMAPSGDYSTVTAVDGTTWYKQYAADTVQRTPYKAPDNTIAYKESIVKKLPDPPRRKDRV